MPIIVNNLSEIIGKNIKMHRRRLGLSQEKLANKIGVGDREPSKWESGKVAPNAYSLYSLSQIFECKIDDLFE